MKKVILTMTTTLSLILFIIIAFTSCRSSKSVGIENTMQVIQNKFRQYEPSASEFSRPMVSLDIKVWYKDSMAIEEVKYLRVITDSNNHTITDYPIQGYRFNDLRKRVVFEYKDFCDTAEFVRKYSLDDTLVQIIGGWNFNYQRHWDYSEAPKNLPDTIIGKISYKRVSISRGTPELPYIMICYFRCDKIGTIFNLDSYISKTIGCPLTKIYHFSPIKKGLHISNEISFLSDTLSQDELKVFDAWEKNSKKYPVNH